MMTMATEKAHYVMTFTVLMNKWVSRVKVKNSRSGREIVWEWTMLRRFLSVCSSAQLGFNFPPLHNFICNNCHIPVDCGCDWKVATFAVEYWPQKHSLMKKWNVTSTWTHLFYIWYSLWNEKLIWNVAMMEMMYVGMQLWCSEVEMGGYKNIWTPFWTWRIQNRGCIDYCNYNFSALDLNMHVAIWRYAWKLSVMCSNCKLEVMAWLLFRLHIHYSRLFIQWTQKLRRKNLCWTK